MFFLRNYKAQNDLNLKEKYITLFYYSFLSESSNLLCLKFKECFSLGKPYISHKMKLNPVLTFCPFQHAELVHQFDGSVFQICQGLNPKVNFPDIWAIRHWKEIQSFSGNDKNLKISVAIECKIFSDIEMEDEGEHQVQKIIVDRCLEQKNM